MARHLIYLLLFSAFLFTGCKKQDNPNFHFEYFGMQTGRFVIYDVMEIKHDTQVSPAHDTVRYQLKTVWEGKYIDNEGRTASVFRRYKRDSALDSWVLSDVWTGIYDGIRAELIEENQRVVKLVFAPTLTKEWDANAYNNFGSLDCYYEFVHVDTTINGTFFDSTVFVRQDNFISLIDSIQKYEVYAKNIGLLTKFSKDNRYDFGGSEPQEGTEVYYNYVSHGFE